MGGAREAGRGKRKMSGVARVNVLRGKRNVNASPRPAPRAPRSTLHYNWPDHEHSSRDSLARHPLLDSGRRPGRRPASPQMDSLSMDAGRLRTLQTLGIFSGLTAGAWLGAAEAPTKL